VAWETQGNCPNDSSDQQETSLCLLAHDNATPPPPRGLGADIEALRSTEQVTDFQIDGIRITSASYFV
jgi:hypothetical protein